jgi:hypothetical protein
MSVAMTDYRAMTVNERLFASGLLQEFDLAARGRDASRMTKILLQVQMTPEQAENTIRALLKNPEYYGY